MADELQQEPNLIPALRVLTEAARRLYAHLPTEALAAEYERAYPAAQTQAERAAVDALEFELARRYRVQAQAMTSRELVDALAPLADYREPISRAEAARRTAIMGVLVQRHPEASRAEDAWADTAEEGSAEFEAGPAGPVIAAVRAALGD